MAGVAVALPVFRAFVRLVAPSLVGVGYVAVVIEGAVGAGVLYRHHRVG